MKTAGSIRSEWPAFVLLLIPFIMIYIFWNDFPAQVPMHWNFEGEVDSYSGKGFGLLAIPVFNIVIYTLFYVLPNVDPRKKNYKLFKTSYNVLRYSIIGFMFFLFIIIFMAGLGQDLNVGRIVINLTLILFLIIGNFMGKIKSNYFVGVRTPWTLENPEIWNKTHRLAGKLWVGATLIMLIVNFFIPIGVLTVLYFVYIGIIVVVPVGYSYILHRKLI